MSDWRTTELGALCEIVSGVTKDAKRARPDMRQVPYLRVANVQRLRLALDDLRTIAATEGDIASYALQPGDVLLNEGGDRDKLGRGWIWEGQVPLCIHQNHVFRARIRDAAATPKWIAYYSNSDAAQAYFFGAGKQTTNLASISSTRLKGLPIPVPSIEEQHRIVAAIETHFSRLDAAVASLTRAKANVKRARASVLRAAVEGRLVPTEAALARAEGREYEPAAVLLDRILAEREAAWAASGARGKYKEPVKPETEGLPGLPEGWCWAGLDQTGTWSSGGTPSRSRPDFYGGSVPWVKTGELADGDIRSAEEHITQAGLDGSSAKVFPAGTLLVAMYGATIGMTARLVVPAATNQACAALLPNAGNIEVLPYLWKLLISQRAAFRKVGQGGAQPNISQTIIKSWPVPLPPLAEQHRIVAEVDRRLSVLDALDATLDANLARCARLRQSILKRAFEGRLVPAEPPTDPPPRAAAPQLPLFAQRGAP